jgi:hypothetical protein
MPTSLRIALLAAILALASNVAVIGFIHWQTYDESVQTLRRQVTDQNAFLADIYRNGGMAALQSAVEDVDADDPQAEAGVGGSPRPPLLGGHADGQTQQKEGDSCAHVGRKDQTAGRAAAQ